ncbi:MAG: hypothetical protein DMG93_20110 [Acidobacteria bacterium]|nr:MAG: hypothetical protein DMG93_20110 [Acidobacteriota bacterium]
MAEYHFERGFKGRIMRRAIVCIVALVFLLAASVSLAKDPARPAEPTSGYVPVHNFDPKRDATADIQAAMIEAQRTGKRIILDVGGDWCQYCHQMDQFFNENPTLRELRDNRFITVLIYYGTDNKNQHALSRYSKILGVPHFFVLEKDGTLLYSQHVLDLRSNGRYDPQKMKDFLVKWSPPNA